MPHTTTRIGSIQHLLLLLLSRGRQKKKTVVKNKGFPTTSKMGQELTKLTPEEMQARQIKEMDAEMRQKLQKGANYNSKHSLARASGTR